MLRYYLKPEHADCLVYTVPLPVPIELECGPSPPLPSSPVFHCADDITSTGKFLSRSPPSLFLHFSLQSYLPVVSSSGALVVGLAATVAAFGCLWVIWLVINRESTTARSVLRVSRVRNGDALALADLTFLGPNVPAACRS